MTFKSDSKKLRTFDEERGWELSVESRSGGENHQFKLSNVNGERFSFVGILDAVEKVEDAPGEYLKRWRIRLGRGADWDRHRQLIEDALMAYGTVFNGPSGPILCSFE